MKPFTTLAILLISAAAVLQLTRFLRGWVVTVDGATIPVWISGVAAVVLGVVAAMLWRESRSSKQG
ncbi:MAG: hypothetical protein ACRER4_06775 [Steroidobacteraceae bacterium]